jgi:hypothetical protein
MVVLFKSYFGKSVSSMWSGYKERVKVCLWLREAIAEYLELTWTGSPYEFRRMLSDPNSSRYLDDKPALRMFLYDMLDLGVVGSDSVLLMRRDKFLELVEKIFREVGMK